MDARKMGLSPSGAPTDTKILTRPNVGTNSPLVVAADATVELGGTMTATDGGDNRVLAVNNGKLSQTGTNQSLGNIGSTTPANLEPTASILSLVPNAS